MTTYAVLLRAVNLGKVNKVPMAHLRDGLTGLGYADVRTYLLSGNAVLRSDRSEDDVADEIHEFLQGALGLRVGVLVRPYAELDALIAANPFLAPTREPTQVVVTFLSRAPRAAEVRDLRSGLPKQEEFHVHGRAVFLRFPGSLLSIQLGNKVWEGKLGMVATTRTWKTVSGLHRIAADAS